MKTLLKIFLGLALIGMVGKACDSSKTGLPNDGSGDNPSDADGADIFSNKESTSEEYTLDAASLSSCENYLKERPSEAAAPAWNSDTMAP
ncbi:MAG: hypothetical protein IPO12_05885 [Flavobacteriales bacterium]|nr:hypothetical protein [Flavobacteriales bacterium]